MKEQKPTPEQAIPAEDSAESTESAETTEKPDLAGYDSVESLVAGTYASRKEAKRLAQRVAELETVVTRSAPGSAAERRALDEIDALGLPAETFRAAVRDEARAIVAAELAPMLNANAAVQNMRTNNPDFAEFESDFNQWLSDNPSVSSDYQEATAGKSAAAAALALEGVFAQFARARTGARRGSVGGGRKVPAAAQIPASQGAGGGSRKAPASGPTKAEVKELILEARNSGDPTALMRAMLGDRGIHRELRPRGQ